MLTLHNICAIRDERTLFKGVGLTLFPGSLLVIRGSNGSGKTTLLRIIAGLLKPEQGEVCWNEVNIHKAYDEYCSIMSYLGHKQAINPLLTVRDNLSFYAGLKDVAELLPAAIAHFGIAPVLDIPAHKLSAGWKQRVALARMAASNAKLWILDEPSTHLDKTAQEQLMYMITSRCHQGGMVVMASHGEVPIKGAIEFMVGS
jgi:heme exporter protein A